MRGRGKIIDVLLKKHFQHPLTPEGHDEIKDFPKPTCLVLANPKLDDEIRNQIKCLLKWYFLLADLPSCALI